MITATVDTGTWFRHWFDSTFYHQLYRHRSEKEAAGFIDALLESLDPGPGAAMLDLGCGSGRHAKHLASRGFDVTGIDLAASSIRQARHLESPTLHFVRQDMREPFGIECFDYVFNFFTSFGYFSGEKEHEGVLQNIYRALKPGGTLVMDYLNVQYADDRLVDKEEKEIDGIRYQIARWVDQTHFYKRILVKGLFNGEKPEFIEKVARFRLDDFQQMFSRNGLCLQQVYGDYELSDYDPAESPRMILMAKKLIIN